MNPKCQMNDIHVLTRDADFARNNFKTTFYGIISDIVSIRQAGHPIKMFRSIHEDLERGIFLDCHLETVATYYGCRIFNLRHDHEAYIAYAETRGMGAVARDQVTLHDIQQAKILDALFSAKLTNQYYGYLNEGTVTRLRARDNPELDLMVTERLRMDTAALLELEAVPIATMSRRVVI